MSYTHFGKQADVWKHIVLAEILNIEAPNAYVETNSAFASYTLSATPEQQYGIFYFLENAPDFQLADSVYFSLENAAVKNTSTYIGSPGIAIEILKNKTDKFYFFDLEKDALNSVAAYAQQNGMRDKVILFNKDSIGGTLEILPELTETAFIHIDPYCINCPDANNNTYFDVFVMAAKQEIKCLLWYGFNTLQEKELLNNYIIEKLNTCRSGAFYGVELIMNIIENETIPCNPGIMGSGLLGANLSEKSISLMSVYADKLTNMYKNSNYQDFAGSLYKDERSINF